MFDHVHLPVASLAESRRFYEAAPAPLGTGVVTDTEELVAPGSLSPSEEEPQTPPLPFAFFARSREAVDAFHLAGVEAGFRDNGAPGLRSYADDDYAAYLLDPDGHNVEAVHRSRETRAEWDWMGWPE